MHCAIDTNLLIYFFDSRSPWHKKAVGILGAAEMNKLKISGSELLFAEMLAYPKLSDRAALDIESKLRLLPIDYHSATLEIFIKASTLHRRYSSLKLADAIHVATAITAKADRFMTNDSVIIGLRKIEGVAITPLV